MGRVKPREEQKVVDAHAELGTGAGFPGDYTIKPSKSFVKLIMPVFEGNKAGPLVFRPFPVTFPKNPQQFQPARIGDSQSMWLCVTPLVSRVGVEEDRVTYIPYPPGTKDD